MQDKLRPPALFNFAYPGTGLLVLFFLEFRFIDYFFFTLIAKIFEILSKLLGYIFD